jgi:hypothetical protein
MDTDSTAFKYINTSLARMQRGLNGDFKRMAFFFSVIVIEMYRTEMGKSFMVAGFVRRRKY